MKCHSRQLHASSSGCHLVGVVSIRILAENVDARVIAHLPVTPTGAAAVSGDCAISGVPGTAAPVDLEFLDPTGGGKQAANSSSSTETSSKQGILGMSAGRSSDAHIVSCSKAVPGSQTSSQSNVTDSNSIHHSPSYQSTLSSASPADVLGSSPNAPQQQQQRQQRKPIFPTGRVKQALTLSDGCQADVTLLDVGNQMVFCSSSSVAVTQQQLVQHPALLDADSALMTKLELIRQQAAEVAGWRVTDAQPKITLIAPATVDYISTSAELVKRCAYDVLARSVSVGNVHRTYPAGVLMATAVAAGIPGTVVHEAQQQAVGHRGGDAFGIGTLGAAAAGGGASAEGPRGSPIESADVPGASEAVTCSVVVGHPAGTAAAAAQLLRSKDSAMAQQSGSLHTGHHHAQNPVGLVGAGPGVAASRMHGNGLHSTASTTMHSSVAAPAAAASDWAVQSVTMRRTARRIMQGFVMIPQSAFVP